MLENIQKESEQLGRVPSRNQLRSVVRSVEEQPDRIETYIGFLESENLLDKSQEFRFVLDSFHRDRRDEMIYARGLCTAGDYREVVRTCANILKRGDYKRDALYLLSLAYVRDHSPEHAVAPLDIIILSDANDLEARALRALALKQLHKYEEAITGYLDLLKLKINGSYLNNVGLCYAACEDYASALDAFCLSLRNEKILYNRAAGLSNIANVYKARGDYERSMRIYKQALKIFPDFKDALNNLGTLYHDIGLFEEAVECYRKAISLDESFHSAHSNLATTLLLLGSFPEAWERYEHRHLPGGHCRPPHIIPRGPLWSGDDIISDNLLVVSEQGLGDTLMYSRYLQNLRSSGIKVTLAVQESLVELLSFSNIADKTIPHASVDMDARTPWIPLISICKLLDIDLHRQEPSSPYLMCNKSASSLPLMLSRRKGKIKRIGLSWQGNKDTEKGNLRGRSLALSELDRFISLREDLEFISLQQGWGSEQLEGSPNRERIVSPVDIVGRDLTINETAHLVTTCSYVITVDTMIGHLAGAIGVPTILLLKHIPDYRWGLTGERHPLYPAHHILRQTRNGDWKSAVNRIGSIIDQ